MGCVCVVLGGVGDVSDSVRSREWQCGSVAQCYKLLDVVAMQLQVVVDVKITYLYGSGQVCEAVHVTVCGSVREIIWQCAR